MRSFTHSKKPNTYNAVGTVSDIRYPKMSRYRSHALEVHFYPSLVCTFERKRWASPFTVVQGLRSAMSSEELKHCVPKRVESPLGRSFLGGLFHYTQIL